MVSLCRLSSMHDYVGSGTMIVLVTTRTYIVHAIAARNRSQLDERYINADVTSLLGCAMYLLFVAVPDHQSSSSQAMESTAALYASHVTATSSTASAKTQSSSK